MPSLQPTGNIDGFTLPAFVYEVNYPRFAERNSDDASDADNVISVTGTHDAHDLVRRTDRATVTQGCGLSRTVATEAVTTVKPLEASTKREVLHSGGTRVTVLVSAVGPRCSRSSRQQADAKATVATSGHRDSNVIHANANAGVYDA
jgi:hypothetical protein